MYAWAGWVAYPLKKGIFYFFSPATKKTNKQRIKKTENPGTEDSTQAWASLTSSWLWVAHCLCLTLSYPALPGLINRRSHYSQLRPTMQTFGRTKQPSRPQARQAPLINGAQNLTLTVKKIIHLVSCTEFYVRSVSNISLQRPLGQEGCNRGGGARSPSHSMIDRFLKPVWKISTVSEKMKSLWSFIRCKCLMS